MISLQVRLATLDDGEQLLAWRNHPSGRENSLFSGLIAYEQHMLWLTNFLQNPQAIFLLAEQNSLAVAQLRAIKEADGRVFLSWMTAPEKQGQGLGKHFLQNFCNITAIPLFARIKTSNIASQKIAAYAGFAPLSLADNYEIWGRAALLAQATTIKNHQTLVDAINQQGTPVDFLA